MQIEIRLSILQTRAEILAAEGFHVTSVLGNDPRLRVMSFGANAYGANDYGVIVVGSWEQSGAPARN